MAADEEGGGGVLVNGSGTAGGVAGEHTETQEQDTLNHQATTSYQMKI